jgi:hemerythrin-like domain-containing protein
MAHKRSKSNRIYDNDGKSENDKVRALRKKIKDQEKEIQRLKNELKTLNKAFEKSAAYMSSQSKHLKVEELISAANKDHTLEQAKATYIDEKTAREREKEDIREKWRKWRLENRTGETDET